MSFRKLVKVISAQNLKVHQLAIVYETFNLSSTFSILYMLRRKNIFFALQLWQNPIENPMATKLKIINMFCFHCLQSVLQSSILIFKSSKQVESIKIAEAEYN